MYHLYAPLVVGTFLFGATMLIWGLTRNATAALRAEPGPKEEHPSDVFVGTDSSMRVVLMIASGPRAAALVLTPVEARAVADRITGVCAQVERGGSR